MKTSLRSFVVTGLTICAALWTIPETVSGQIYVANYGSGTIGEYTTAGATVNASLVSGLNGLGLAVSGGDLFVANVNAGTIGEYTTAGTTVNAALVSGLDSPFGIAVSGGDLFVANWDYNSTIGEYTTAGATVNASLVSGLSLPAFLDVEEVPEPSSFGLLALGLGVLPLLRRQSR